MRREVLLLLDNLASGGVNLLAIPGNAVDVVSNQGFFGLLGFELGATPHACLGIGLEGVLDTLGDEEPGVYLSACGGVEGVGLAVFPLACLVVVLGVLAGGVG